MTWTIGTILTRVINFVLAIVTFFIGVRIILRLFSANAATPFVGWIYNVSDSLIYPFSGIFPNYSLSSGTTIDVVSLVALIAYAILGYIIVSVLSNIFRIPGDTYVHPEHRHI